MVGRMGVVQIRPVTMTRIARVRESPRIGVLREVQRKCMKLFNIEEECTENFDSGLRVSRFLGMDEKVKANIKR
jgi:hypothetical protein